LDVKLGLWALAGFGFRGFANPSLIHATSGAAQKKSYD